MIPIDEVNVSVAGRAEQHGVARGLSGEGVRCWIVRAEIGFVLDHTSGEQRGPFARDRSLPSISRATVAGSRLKNARGSACAARS